MKKAKMKTPFKPKYLPLESLDWTSLISLIAEANASLARYDGLLESIPDSEIFLSPLMTQEAVLSSKIEGTQATLEEVLEYEVAPDTMASNKHDDIEEVLNYRKAMDIAKSELKERPLCLNLIKGLHSELLDGVRGQYKARGEFRTSQNWIGAPGTPMDQATYIPPSPQFLEEYLDNWEHYCHHEERDKLVQLSIIHAQMELIHPFLDGNGRIGRILIPLFLWDKKLLRNPVFYISAFFERNRKEYYSKLEAISEEDAWNPWIEYFLKAIIEQAKDNSKKVKDVRSLWEIHRKKVAEVTHSHFSFQVVDFLFQSPIFTSTLFAAQTKIPKPSVARILKFLVDEEVVVQVQPAQGRRPALYCFYELLKIIQE
ncbi:MAG: Fic family protein [Smithella sp.]